MAFLAVEKNCCYSWIHQEQFVYNSSIRRLANKRKRVRAFLAFKPSSKNYDFAKSFQQWKTPQLFIHINLLVNVCFFVFFICAFVFYSLSGEKKTCAKADYKFNDFLYLLSERTIFGNYRIKCLNLNIHIYVFFLSYFYICYLNIKK